ncbi:HD domain-containing protein [Halocatena pleomorpha]|uniref:HD domain-containing protein n=1 Tax=Halocatena pleomorpha TaxID=1785090 RepID=A0A3P3RKE9_9EURY|nr:HD domain-containing protein [Halocatena pleomorpha]RRJ34017.1 HD domain-containing protein [Halocatena pleomorpha]
MDHHHEAVEQAFPELATIESDDLRTGVREAWAIAMADNDIDDLETVAWFPPVQRGLGLADELLVPHIRDVTQGAITFAEILQERRSIDLSVDTLVAGALVHDVSKLYEFDGMEPTSVGDLLGHPYYGVYVVAAVGLPVELAHIVLSHTHRTSVEPATLEAAIIRQVDNAAATAIRSQAVTDLRKV